MLKNPATQIWFRHPERQSPLRQNPQPHDGSPIPSHSPGVRWRFLASRDAKLGRGHVFLLVVVWAVVSLTPSILSAEDRTPTPPQGAAVKTPGEASAIEELYRERSARNPRDLVALEGLAILQARRGDYAEAIASYQRALKLAPDDRDAKTGLARTLALSGQYDYALAAYRSMLKDPAEDSDALEGIARVYMWSGRPSTALPIFRELAAWYPANPEYAIDLARVEMNLNRFPEAHQILDKLLTANPRDRDAQLQLAYLELREGRQADALQRFNRLIAQDPRDPDALRGNARVAFYRGDLQYAHNLARKLVEDDPRDASTLLLLAYLERALHNTREAQALLARAQALDPRNEEAQELTGRLHDESRLTLHTSASFAREISSGNSFGDEDLRAFGYETTLGFSALPRSDSYISLYYLPSDSPSGGVQGAVGASEFLYRQTTYLTPQLTLRGGVGLTRFGPGELEGIPTQADPIRSAGFRPLGFGNLSYAVRKKLTLNLTAARSALTYTPTAVRLGVMEDRGSAGLNYRFNAQTELNLDSFYAISSTIAYDHVLTANGQTLAVSQEADHNRAQGGSITFIRNLFRKDHATVDLGYSGLLYGFAGGPQKSYLGLFNPDFYQRHTLIPHVYGKLRGPWGYDFSGGFGVQQVEHAAALTPALLLSPALTLRTGPREMLTLGYIHYDCSPSLGSLRGNAVRLSTDWKF
jgi:Flp pilus assembly protein TadD